MASRVTERRSPKPENVLTRTSIAWCVPSMSTFDDGEVRQQCSICFTMRTLGGQLATEQPDQRTEFVAPHRLPASTSTHRCGCGSTTTWSGAARPTSAEQRRRRAAAGSDRSPPAARDEHGQWPDAPDHRADSGAGPWRCARQGSWVERPARWSFGEGEGIDDRSILDREDGQSSSKSRSSASRRAPEAAQPGRPSLRPWNEGTGRRTAWKPSRCSDGAQPTPCTNAAAASRSASSAGRTRRTAPPCQRLPGHAATGHRRVLSCLPPAPSPTARASWRDDTLRA